MFNTTEPPVFENVLRWKNSADKEASVWSVGLVYAEVTLSILPPYLLPPI